MAKFATIILAAGNGTRMKSDLPKVMHKLANKPMLWHVLSAAEKFGSAKNIVIAQDSHADVKALADSFANTEIAVQSEQRGTGDAVKAAQNALAGFDGKILILNGDSPLIGYLGDEISKFLNAEEALSVLAFEPAENFGYGRLILEDKNVLGIVEEKDASEDEKMITLCNTGIYAVDSKLLFELLAQLSDDNSQGEYYLTDIVKIAVQKGLAISYAVAENPLMVAGVNNKMQLSDCEQIMQDELCEAALEAGVTIISPADTFLSADTKFGRDVVLKPFIYIAENVEIGDNVQIGPFAHLRPGTRLENGTKVGNFVEVKNSTIGQGSKLNHLSYIGDSELGRNVNVGAGTITCNYDGVNKFRTEIGDGAFIGSNSALVAPVKIGANSMVGAGSTITSDVQDDDLAVSRSVQKNLTGGAKRFKKKSKK